jgi:diaminohydroxyphosphoribosylaminopyrimidine deaminase/5-amino-6-(5-phosphoribosylamino)uracil reductase
VVKAHESAMADGTSVILVPTVIVRMREADNIYLRNISCPERRLFWGFFMDNNFYMKNAIKLAKKGAGYVSPNPMVGAVLVKGDRIVSKGYHQYFGGPHAEINALSKLKKNQTQNATLFVNLEPCSHQGKTPPCVDTIIQSGISKVVIGTIDPNPLVGGKGINSLKKHGIKVISNIQADACHRLNEAYFKYITREIPFVTLKIAQTLDGKIATQTGHSKWITSETSRKWVHRLRSENDCVIVGIDTILADDPELSVRHLKRRNPKRIILDSRLRIPLNSKILHHPDPENTILVTTQRSNHSKRKNLEDKGIAVWINKSDALNKIDLSSLLKALARNGIASVLVEGGKGLFTSFLNAKAADRIISFIAPRVFGKGMDIFGDLRIKNTNHTFTFHDTEWRKIGCDMMFQGRVMYVHGNH